jgi:hypothetical protein
MCYGVTLGYRSAALPCGEERNCKTTEQFFNGGLSEELNVERKVFSR